VSALATGQANYGSNILNQCRSYFHWKYAPCYSKTTSFLLLHSRTNFCYSSSNADSKWSP